MVRIALNIYVTTGVGEASTSLAAFDCALFQAGIGDYNLVVLSSVIPPAANVLRKQWHAEDEQWGHKLYVVLAEQRAEHPGQEAWAGLGWVQNEEDGRGLFVEHHGHSRQQVEDDIGASLASMCAYRTTSFGAPQMAVVGTSCTGLPACAVAAAVYQSRGWNASFLEKGE